MTFKFGNWPIFYKIMFTIMIIVFFALTITTAIHVNVLRTQMREQIGAQFASLADTRVEYIVDTLTEQITLLRSIALDSTVVGTLETANARYSDDASTNEYMLLDTDRQWIAAPDDSALVQSIVDPTQNALTAQLLAHAETLATYGEVLITDRYGGLVAATRRTTDYYQADEDWWQAVYAGGRGAFYIGQPAYDESAGYIAVNLAVPIYSPQNRVLIGVLRSTLNMDLIYQAMKPWGETTVTLVNEDRVILADSNPQRVGQSIPSSWPVRTGSIGATWLEARDDAGQVLLIGRAATADAAVDGEMAAAIRPLGWSLFIYQPQAVALAPLTRAIWLDVGVAILLVLLAALAAVLISRRLVNPLVQILAVVRQWMAGDRTQRAPVYGHDETGELATSWNQMADEIRQLEQAAAHRLAERESEQKRRARDLNVTTLVGNVISVTSNLPELLPKVADLIREQFELYYVGLFLLDDTAEWAVFYAGTGDVGKRRLAQEYRVQSTQGLVGRCVAGGSALVVREDEADSDLVDKSGLPDTRAAVALPLRSRGQILGAIEAHSYQRDAFDAESIIVLQTIADQVAVAIDGLRLYAERQEAMESLQRAYGEAAREAWTALLLGRAAGAEGYQAEIRGLAALPPTPPDTWRADARVAWKEGRVVTGVEENGEAVLALPIRLRDEVIGVIDVSKRKDAGDWLPEEISHLEELVEQVGLTLESSRFYQESQRAAAREQLLREISERIRVAVDVDSVMRIAAREIGDVLQRPVFVYIADESQRSTPAGTAPGVQP
ncbi:MAG TPA: GAF domain-containing protein [Anaerolineae bacterium]|nr:GAF domain-containing protein [Anaerolineae bacterium]HQH37075.1 GAF domain-containing protein [Anaerolineae bacterium]